MGLRNSFVLRRMGSARLLLGSVLLSTLIAASLAAALAGFAASSLPQAVSGELAQSPHTAIAISGAFNATQARTDRSAVPAAIRGVFRTIPVALHEALWSDPIELPDPDGHGAVPLTQAAALGQIRTNAVLAAGTWPASPAPGAPIQAAVPGTVADALHLAPGAVLSLRDRVTGARVRFRLTGIYRPLNPASPYWGLDLIGTSGISSTVGFTTYGPLVVAPGAFGPGGLAVGAASWLAVPDTGRISASDLMPLARRIAAMQAYLTQSPNLGGLQLSTGLPAALAGLATKLVVARSLLAVGALELLLLVAAALTLTARTLANQREDESAVLNARGASRWQLARLAIAEALLVTLVAAVAGALAGSRLAGLLASSGPLRGVGLRVRGVPGEVWLTAGAVLLLCLAIMLGPALRPLSPGSARVRRGRQAALSAVARAGGDAALVLLALLAGWQLRRYSAVGRAAGGIGIDPVLAVAPAIALAAAAVLPLRLLPVLARFADRRAARTRRLSTAMASWEISRRAVRQSAPVLLVVLAVGTGTLALAQHQSWRQSVLDQSAFAVGADVRVNPPAPVPLGLTATIAHARYVTAAMAVTTTLAIPSGGQILALDARSAAATVLLRGDQSALPAAALWRRIIPTQTMGTVLLPGRPARLEIMASLDPGPGADLGTAVASVSIQDAAGVVYSVPAGRLPADGRSHGLVAGLSATRQASYPLRLIAVSLSYTLPPVPPGRRAAAAARRQATFTLRGLALSAAAAGPFATAFAAGGALAGWTPAVAAPGLGINLAAGAPPVLIHRPASRAGATAVSFHPGDGQTGQPGLPPQPPFGPIPAQLTLTAPVPFTVIPGIATAAFLSGGHLAVGDVLQVAAGSAAVTVRIVAAVATFPTITDPSGGLIVDQGAAQDVVAGQGAPPLAAGEWWLSTAGGAVPPGLPPGSIVTDRVRSLSDPLSVIPQQAVQAIAVAAALIAILGFSVSIAGSVRERRSQSALLAALGVGGSAQARTLCLEALTLSLPAAATGLLLGALLARVIVPAVTLTAAATTPIPPALVEIPLAPAIGLALAIAAIPVLVAAATAAYRPDPAAQLRTSEAT